MYKCISMILTQPAPNCTKSVVLELCVQPRLGCLGLTQDSRTTDFQLGLLILIGTGMMS